MISVRLRDGSVIIIDDDALSLTPNGQTTVSLLIVWTNQPYAWGSGAPLASSGGVHANESQSASRMWPRFSARSNSSRSRTDEIRPDVGVSVVATYDDRVAWRRASTEYGTASRRSVSA